MLTKDAVAAKIKQWVRNPDLRFQAVIWLLVSALYYPVFKALYKSRWDMIDYSHAYFILPVALFMSWKALNSARTVPDPFQNVIPERLNRESTSWIPRSSRRMTDKDNPLHLAPFARPLWGFPIIFTFALLMFTFGWRQDYISLSTLALIPLLYGLTGWIYGPRVVRVLWFPIAYLVLLVPPPMGIIDSVTLPMRYGVSFTTEHLVKLFGYPVTRDGLLLSIAGHEVFLGEACSGFRSLITLSSLGLAYIFLSKGSTPRKLSMTASIVPLALLGNLIRVVSVVIVTYYCGETWGQKFFHDASGFVMFVVMLVGLLAIENLAKPKQVGAGRMEP